MPVVLDAVNDALRSGTSLSKALGRALTVAACLATGAISGGVSGTASGEALTGDAVAATGPASGANPIAIVQYSYKNSLWDNAAGEGTLHTNATTWVHRLVRAAAMGDSFAETSEFGFVTQWELPPANSSSNPEAPAIPGAIYDSWAGMQAVNRVMFVPDNFDGWVHDPDALANITPGESYEDTLARFIEDWQTNVPHPDGRSYTLYPAWTNLTAQADPATFTGWADWEAENLGQYYDWHKLLESRLQSAFPDLNIDLFPLTPVLMETRRDTALNTLPASDLFEDYVHGRPEWYLLIGAIYYMWAYGKRVPASFTPPADANIHSIFTNNWVAITDYAWNELQEQTGEGNLD